MTPLGAAGMTIEQQAVDLHDTIDPLVVGQLAAFSQRLALEDRMDAPVAVGRQLSDNRLDCGNQVIVGHRGPADSLSWPLPQPFDQIGPGDPITSATVFIANRPWAATAAAAAVF